MSLSKTTILLFILTALVFLLSVACQSGQRQSQNSPERRFDVKGTVLAVDQNKKRIELDHEAIRDAAGKNFMDAMKMEFTVKDEQALARLAPGDQIQATMVYNDTNNLRWLEKVTVVKAARP